MIGAGIGPVEIAVRAKPAGGPSAETVVRTARGTFSEWAQGDMDTFTLNFVNVDAGTWLLVGIINDISQPVEVSLGGVGFTLLESQAAPAGDVQLSVWGAYFVNAVANGDLAALFVGDLPSCIAMLATQVSGLTAAGTLDVTAKAMGTSGTPSSGATALPAQAHQFVWGLIGTVGPPFNTPGTWTNDLSDGQRVGETGGFVPITLSEGYRVTTVQESQTASKTGEVSHPWGAICATFKAAS